MSCATPSVLKPTLRCGSNCNPEGPMLSQISREWAHGALLTILSVLALAVSYAPAAIAWEYWGGDKGGTRFSAIDQITSENVDRLLRAWEFRTATSFVAMRKPWSARSSKI